MIAILSLNPLGVANSFLICNVGFEGFAKCSAFQMVFNNSLYSASAWASIGGGLSAQYGSNGTNAVVSAPCVTHRARFSMVPRILSMLQF